MPGVGKLIASSHDRPRILAGAMRRMTCRYRLASVWLVLGLIAWTAHPATSFGQTDPVITRGVAYLSRGVSGAGEAALAALALIKAEVPADDSALSALLATVAKRFSESTYQPEKGSGAQIYEAGVVILALANHDASVHRAEIEAAARYLMGKQNPNGSWDYDGRTLGDTSISQYAVLGLWEAENAGISVPPSVWDRAAGWYLANQQPSGSWTYHPGEGGAETIAMTAAGVGSLLICTRQLAPYRFTERTANSLLVPLVNDAARRRYNPQTTPQRLRNGIQGGITWISNNFTTSSTQVIGPSPFYALYGVERLGALADQATLGKADWFAEGRKYLAANQRADGSFSASYGEVPNTAWAVLFLTRSTAKSLKRNQIRRLGSGTLVGGRGLPRDLSQVSVAGGKIIARPMDGAVEGMLAALEDPRVEDAGAALTGLIARYGAEGPAALRPHTDRFRKLLRDRDQGVRRVGAWGLARTGDLAVVPDLIGALKDPDEGVVKEARLGLQLLSRMIDGYGPTEGASPVEKAEAIAQWQTWYEAIRPISETTVEPASTGGRKAP